MIGQTSLVRIREQKIGKLSFVNKSKNAENKSKTELSFILGSNLHSSEIDKSGRGRQVTSHKPISPKKPLGGILLQTHMSTLTL